MSELEERVKRALDAKVDAQLGPRRVPPAFVPPSAVGTRRLRQRPGPWSLPLLAAACVVAIAGAAVGVTAALSGHTSAPATRPPSVSSPVPSPATSPVPQPSHRATSTTPAQRRTSHGTRQPAHYVTLGGARLAVPDGWVVRDLGSYLGTGTPVFAPAWCLTPRALPVNTRPGSCPLEFHVIGDLHGGDVDSNIEGGVLGNAEYCGQTPNNTTHEQSEDRTFGGRDADWRRWEINCSSGKNWLIEQYVVTTVPGYVLFSERADTTVHAAMSAIAAASILPPQTLPLRLFDEGYLRGVEHTGAGVRIALDRIAYQDGIVVDRNPQTYSYVVPAAVWQTAQSSGSAIGVGSLVYLETDGQQVTGLYPS